MNTNSQKGTDPGSEFDQAVIAYLQATNPDVAMWVEDTLCEEQTLATIIDTEEYTLDPDDADAVEQIATAIELWVIEVGGDLPTTSAVGSGPKIASDGV